MCTENHSQEVRSEVRQIFVLFWAIFCPFNPLPPKTQNRNHIIYAYSDMECSHRHNFFLFQAFFCSFAPLLTQKQIRKKCKKKKKKKHLEKLSFYTCTINQDHIMYGSWDMKSNRQNVCHCGQFFVLLPPPPPLHPNSMKNKNLKKKMKNSEKWKTKTKKTHTQNFICVK